MALEFCKEVIELCTNGKEKKIYLNLVKVALANHAAFVNIVEFPVRI